VVTIDRDKELTGERTSLCSLLVPSLCLFADGLVVVVVVADACAELDDLWNKRAADAT
jgi:hypothetical protein